METLGAEGVDDALVGKRDCQRRCIISCNLFIHSNYSKQSVLLALARQAPGWVSINFVVARVRRVSSNVAGFAEGGYGQFW